MKAAELGLKLKSSEITKFILLDAYKNCIHFMFNDIKIIDLASELANYKELNTRKRQFGHIDVQKSIVNDPANKTSQVSSDSASNAFQFSKPFFFKIT
jgi:hypothetical protein